MDWGDLRIFLAIARTGTLGAAARVTGQTQPTMGRRLRALEASLGQILFQRTPDGFVLSDAGAVVLNHAERMEEEALGIARQMGGEGEGLSGLLRLSASEWFGVTVLSPVLAAFSRSHPQVTLELITDTRLFNLSRREADLVFRIRPFDEPDVVQRRLMTMQYAAYAAPETDVKTAGLILMDTAFDGLPDVTWLQTRLPDAAVTFRSNNREAQARMCRLGAGIAVLPCLLADTMSGIVRLDMGDAPARDVYMGYHRDLAKSPRLRALITTVTGALS